MLVAYNPIARGPLRGVSRHSATMTLGCLAALGAILTASSMAGRYTGAFYGARALYATVAYVALAVVAYVRPQVLGRRGPSIVAALLAVAMAALFAVRGVAGSDVAGTCGTVCYAAVYAWMTYLLTCLLVRLPTLKLAAVAVVGGTLLRQLLLPVYSLPLDSVAGAAALGLVCLGTVAALAAADAPFMATLRSGESLEVLQLTNPLSALRPPNRLFFAVFLVSVTYNFSNALGVPGLSVRRMVVVFVLLGVLYLLLVQREGQEDRLFSLSALCIMVGLLLAPLFLGRDAFVAHTFLFLGSTCFDILVWLLIYSVGRRSVAAVLPVFAATFALQMFGRFAGANLGRVAFSTVAQDPRGTQTVILLLAIFFFVFIWTAFKGFSFTAAIQGVEALDPVERGALEERTADSQDAGIGGEALRMDAPSLDERCRELGVAAGLTPREQEVLELLARGRNARFIMEELAVTRNTAKAHISHIYAKLGVHSQQELLSLVEGEGWGGKWGSAP